MGHMIKNIWATLGATAFHHHHHQFISKPLGMLSLHNIYIYKLHINYTFHPFLQNILFFFIYLIKVAQPSFSVVLPFIVVFMRSLRERGTYSMGAHIES